MFVFKAFWDQCLAGNLDWVADDIRVELVMQDSTAADQWNAATFADFTTLARNDAAGYAAVTLGSRAIVTDLVGSRMKLDAADTVFAALVPGSSPPRGAIIYKHTGAADNQKIPLLWIDDGFVSIPTGSDYTVVWASNGIASF